MSQAIPVESIKRLDIKPGDVLVATLPGHIAPEAWKRLAEYLTAQLPESVRLIFVTNDVDLRVVSSTDPQPTQPPGPPASHTGPHLGTPTLDERDLNGHTEP